MTAGESRMTMNEEDEDVENDNELQIDFFRAAFSREN